MDTRRATAMTVTIITATLTLPGSATAERPRGGAACASTAVTAVDGKTKRRMRQSILCLVNRERATRGLKPLRPARQLRVSAQRHTYDMRRRGYFGHVTPAGGVLYERVRRTGYLARASGRWTVGETLAWGAGSRGTPAGLVDALLDSPTHRRVILEGGYRELGVGLALGSPTAGMIPGAATMTLVFGARGSGGTGGTAYETPSG